MSRLCPSNATIPPENLMVQTGKNEPHLFAGLERAQQSSSGVTMFSDFLGLAYNSSFGSESPVSLFDFSVPAHCPELLEHLDLENYDHAFGLPDLPREYYSGASEGVGYPRLFVHPAGAQSNGHVDAESSYFFIRLLQGEKLVRVWPLSADLDSVEFTPEATFSEGAESAARPNVTFYEFLLRDGDVLMGYVNGVHAVKTLRPSLSGNEKKGSINYFPKHVPLDDQPLMMKSTLEFRDAVVAEVAVTMASTGAAPTAAFLQQPAPGQGERPKKPRKNEVMISLEGTFKDRDSRRAGHSRVRSLVASEKVQAAVIVVPKSEIQFPSLINEGWFKNRIWDESGDEDGIFLQIESEAEVMLIFYPVDEHGMLRVDRARKLITDPEKFRPARDLIIQPLW
ncbi:hypothetical protein TrVE_jg8622 [Triparma verrucosa]|uniref:JmjC domain-containing protein n=1 Tax=Triparma verrucosa TaxID=1606542 RepID=A0A9W7KU48_9STRA|nr:hypothetical protein TrVE_jg8622 [Triparma verrucosa]